jgi:hypothetical protein
MRHLKRGKDFMSDINKFVTKLKINFNEFLKNVQTEGRETKELFDLVLKESRGELYDENGQKRHLTTEEKNKIKDQAADIFKVLGLTSLSILPGGTLVFILLKVFKQEDKILPSSFLSEEQKKKKSDIKK